MHTYISEEKYDSFRYLYCNSCSTKQFLTERFWKCHSSKLPEDVEITHLMRHWGQLGESWNSIDVLGCLLSHDEKNTVVINARRFLLRPEQHRNTVHADIKTKPQKSSISTSMKSLQRMYPYHHCTIALPPKLIKMKHVVQNHQVFRHAPLHQQISIRQTPILAHTIESEMYKWHAGSKN